MHSFNHFPTITQAVKSRDGPRIQDNVTPSPSGSCTDREEEQLEAGTMATGFSLWEGFSGIGSTGVWRVGSRNQEQQ